MLIGTKRWHNLWKEEKKQSGDKIGSFIQISTYSPNVLIYNPIKAMEFWAMFTFQLDNTEK